MEEKNTFQLFLHFLKDRLNYIILFLIFSAIYALTFFLYNISSEPILYSLLLCSIIAFFWCGVHFFYYCKKHKERMMILRNIEIEYENIPKSSKLSETDYRFMIEEFGKKSTAVLTQLQNNQKENIEYYSAWIHQIKTPISAMQMLIQTGEDTSENRQLLSELFRIEQYAEMALNYVRLDSISTDFVFNVYELDEVIKKAVRKFAPQFISKKIRLIYEPSDTKALTDEKWLLFIIEQLLSNAAKYTFKGSVTITVTDDKKIIIRDTGIGIAEEDLPRIFEKGFTGYNGRSNTKSTGLGLYLSKKAADKISAKITAESETGSGSAFTVDLRTDELEVE